MRDFPHIIEGVRGDRVYFTSGHSAHIAGLRGHFYARNLEALAHHFEKHTQGVVGKGSPRRGMTRLQRGRHLYVYDIDHAWTMDAEKPITEEAERIKEWREILGRGWNYTAAGTAVGMIGERGRMWRRFVDPLRESYRGGYQWSIPGFYQPAHFFDLNEAYGHALFDHRMPRANSWVKGKSRHITDNVVVHATVRWAKHTPTFVMPNHASQSYAFGINDSEPFLRKCTAPQEIWMWAFELERLDPFIDSLRIINTYSCALSWRLPEIVEGLPKPLRKRLQNHLYGAFGVQPLEFQAYAVVGREAAEARVPEKWAEDPSLLLFHKRTVWWAKREKTTMYARPDVASYVTALVRRKMLDAYWSCYAHGSPVVQMYVDGIVTTSPTALATGGWRGEWRLDQRAAWASIGYPGCYLTPTVAHAPGATPTDNLYPDPMWCNDRYNQTLGRVTVNGAGGHVESRYLHRYYAYLPNKAGPGRHKVPALTEDLNEIRTKVPPLEPHRGALFELAYCPMRQRKQERGQRFGRIRASATRYHQMHVEHMQKTGQDTPEELGAGQYTQRPPRSQKKDPTSDARVR